MQRQLLCSVLALGAASGVAFAKDPPKKSDKTPVAQPVADKKTDAKSDAPAKTGNDAVDRALARQYPGAKITMRGERTVNGVKVYDCDIERDGTSSATVTENGDFLVSGVPMPADKLPAPVKEATSGLLGTASDVDSFVSTNYFVYLNAGKQQYQLTLDASGRLLDVKNQKELRSEAKDSTRDKASAEDAKRIGDDARKRTQGDKVQIGEVYKSPDTEGFFIVETKNDRGSGFMTYDSTGDVASIRSAVDSGSLPKPVTQTVQQLFKSGKIGSAQRGESRYFQVRENAGGDTLTLKIRPNGDVMEVRSNKPTTEEETKNAPKKTAKK